MDKAGLQTWLCRMCENLGNKNSKTKTIVYIVLETVNGMLAVVSIQPTRNNTYRFSYNTVFYARLLQDAFTSIFWVGNGGWVQQNFKKINQFACIPFMCYTMQHMVYFNPDHIGGRWQNEP